jgi:hypothetical protein
MPVTHEEGDRYPLRPPKPTTLGPCRSGFERPSLIRWIRQVQAGTVTSIIILAYCVSLGQS